MPRVLQIDAYNQALSPCLQISSGWIDTQLHAALPLTRLPGYNRQFPGPVIEADQNHTFNIEWNQQLPAEISRLPITATGHEKNQSTSQNNEATKSILVTYKNNLPAAARGYFTPFQIPGREQHNRSPAGMWIIRDTTDKTILSALHKYELPLLMQDCYLESDDTGNLTGKLLADNNSKHCHTMVNGKIWPYAIVQARPYRFRLLNASASGQYQLMLHDDNNNPCNSAIHQLGTTDGRLARIIYFSDTQLLPLVAGESVDILIDFSRFRGHKIRIVNTHETNTMPTKYLVRPVMEFRVNAQESGINFTTLSLPI